MARRDDADTEAQAGLAAGGATGVLERPEGAASTNGTSDAGEAPSTAKRTRTPKEYGPNDIVGVMIRVPNPLRLMIEKTATEQSVSVPQIISRMIADAYGYALPEAAKKTRAKYASDEDRKKAQKETSDKKRAQVRALLAAVESGQIQVDVDALVAEMQAKQEAEAKAKAAADATNTSAEGSPEPAMAGAAS